jgi:hypothetical protein
MRYVARSVRREGVQQIGEFLVPSTAELSCAYTVKTCVLVFRTRVGTTPIYSRLFAANATQFHLTGEVFGQLIQVEQGKKKKKETGMYISHLSRGDRKKHGDYKAASI